MVDMLQSPTSEKPFVMGFVGLSGMGKTTLAEQVVRHLIAAGCRVGVVKDAHHRFEMDTPGKDSWRYREAGAQRVIVRSGERWVLLAQEPQPPAIDDLLGCYSDCDIVIVEGFKKEGRHPRMVVWRAAAGQPMPELSAYQSVAGIVTDVPEAFDGVAADRPVFDINDPKAVADRILALREAAQTLR